MPLWGKTDQANNSPLSTPAQFNKTVNTANRDALFGNTTPGSPGVFGVSAAEKGATSGTRGVANAYVSNTGGPFLVRPTITFEEAVGGVNATATAVAIVTGYSANAIGSGYANGDIVALSGGTGTPATGVVTTHPANSSVLSVAVANVGSYTALPTINATPTSNSTGSGSGLTLKTDFGLGPITITNPGAGYATVPAITVGGTGFGTAAAVAVLTAATPSAIAHAGWVLRKEGTGQRAGRVQYETLVATGSIDSDAADDSILPDA